MKIIIIGGGASGLMLASLIKVNHLNTEVTILEKEDRVGKKILLTGNGKCNFSNAYIQENAYNHILGYQIANSFSTYEYFKNLGLLSVCDEQGRYYPLSMSSNTILDFLLKTIEGTTICCNCQATRISKDKTNYIITTNKQKTYEADIVILANGGKTYYKESNGYQLASMLSMHITPLRPSLIGVKVNESLASIVNLRCKALVRLFSQTKLIHEDKGEILFKADGLSGIVIFQMSCFVNRNPFLKYHLELDLLPSMSEDEIVNYLKQYHSMNGLFAKMLNQFILKKANSKDFITIAHTIKHLQFSIVDTYDFKNAQVTAGGVSLDDVNEHLESKANKNCYLCGELLDVDGICGGYNLQFAFASAYRVFLDIQKKLKG